MQITFNEKKKLDTNPIFHLFVQGENMAESIRIVGPKMVGALDLSQLRMAVRVTSAAYETMVEKTLEQTVSDEGTITLVWNVDRQFTSNPGHVQVMLVGYGNNEEVIKITSSGIEVKEDETFISAPQGNTWEQILREMQELATQASASQTAAAASADRAAASEQVAISKAAEIEDAAEQTLANAQAAAQSAAEAAASAASIDTSAFATAAQGEKADTAVQTVNGRSGPAVTLVPELLWTNQTQNSPFNAQTLTLDTKEYTWFIIIYAADNGNRSIVAQLGVRQQLNSATYYNFIRPFTIQAGQVVFESCQYYGTYGSSTLTTYESGCVPWKIIGLM